MTDDKNSGADKIVGSTVELDAEMTDAKFEDSLIELLDAVDTAIKVIDCGLFDVTAGTVAIVRLRETVRSIDERHFPQIATNLISTCKVSPYKAALSLPHGHFPY